MNGRLHSLSTRIAMMVGAGIIVVLGGAALLMDHLVDAEMQQRFDASLLSQARAISALVESGPKGLDIDELQREPSHLLLGDARAIYAVRCDDGHRLVSQPAPKHYPEGWDRSAKETPAFADASVGDVLLRAVWFGFRPAPSEQVSASDVPYVTSCHMLVMMPRIQLDRILYVIDGILLITPMLALIAAFLLSPILVRRGLQPLSALAEHMREVGPHAPRERLPPSTTRELVPLTRRFNEVLARMDESMQRERRFASALAHETRTRLAELHALVDIERKYPSGRAADDVLRDVGVIGGELENTVASLLLLTRLEAGIEKLERNRVDLSALVSEQLGRLEEVLHKRRVHVEVTAAATDTFLYSDTSLLGIIIGNLLRNAAIYVPEGEGVEVRWDTHSLHVLNHAPELDADEVAHLGRRHWRKHSADNEGHAGLGLNLAVAASRALGLRLDFTLDLDQRLRATLRWAESADRRED